MDAKQVLVEYASKIEVEIARYFDNLIPETAKIAPEAVEALSHLKEYTLRKAKRLRAALFYYTYQLAGGQDVAEAFKISIFIELIQSYLLIHDDIMDQDALRRGKPTMHKIYEQSHRDAKLRQDAAHYGDSQAINIGDVACHLAGEILSSSNFPAEHKVQAMIKMHKQIVTVGYGQMLDVLASVKSSVTQSEILRVHYYKTATYTYETPMSIGALLAGASPKDVQVVNDYALPAGVAFQIQDDILGMFGDEEKLGKANTSDLREGKYTLLILKAWEKGNAEQRATIMQALGNSEVTDEMADGVRKIIIDTGSLDYSKTVAVNYVKQAKAALAVRSDWAGEGRDFLDGIADYMINREF